MAGEGLDKIPIRAPREWDPEWFATFVRDVLAQADVRNAIEGAGVSISGQSSEFATLAASAEVQALLDASLVVAADSSLDNQRILTGGTGIALTDTGSSLLVETADVPIGRLAVIPELSVIGQPVDTGSDVGRASAIVATENDRLLRRVGDALNFGQLTPGMFPDSTVGALSSSEIEFSTTLFDVNAVLDLSSYVDLAAITNPGSPGAGTVRTWAEVEQGDYLFLHSMGTAGLDVGLGRDSVQVVRNDTGSTITSGAVVHVTGSLGNVAQVAPARADAKATMPAFAVTTEDIADNAFGLVLVRGIVEGIDLSTFVEGDELYVSATTAGGFTAVLPANPILRQHVGTVLKDTADGILSVSIYGEIGRYTEIDVNETITGDWTFQGVTVVPEATVTAHEAALSIAGSQLTGTVPDGVLSSNVALKAEDEAITGAWTFNDVATFMASGFGAGSAVQIIAASPSLYMSETDFEGSDEGGWGMWANGGALFLGTRDGSGGFGSVIVSIRRSGTDVDTVNFSSGTVSIANSLDLSQDISGSPNLEVMAGRASTTFEPDHIVFGFGGARRFSHAIGTRHRSGGQLGNAIDFYVWGFGVDGEFDVGSLRVLTLDGVDSEFFSSLAWGGGSAIASSDDVSSTSSGSFTGTLTGMSSTTTGTIHWKRTGNRITLERRSTDLANPSDATTMDLQGLPAEIQPTREQYVSAALMRDPQAGTDVVGTAHLNAGSGTINLFPNNADTSLLTLGSWSSTTSTNHKGLRPGWSMTYDLD